MLEYIELNEKNHFLGQDYLYVVRNEDVYRYELVECKGLVIENRGYIHVFNIEYETYYLAFPTKELRDVFKELLEIKSVGLKTAKAILKTFTIDELKRIVQEFKYDDLSVIKGLGMLSCKTIIESLQKKWFDVTYSTKEQRMIQAATRLGFSRDKVLKHIKLVNKKLKEEEYLKQLISMLGKETQTHV